MASHKDRAAVIVVLTCLAICLVTGCKGDKATEPGDEEYVNPDKPNANSLIVSQNTFGDTGTWNTIWQVAEDGAGGYYFIGESNSRYGVGHLDASGHQTWFTRSAFDPRDIYVPPQSAIASDGVLVVGAYDNDGDGESEIGYVSLFGSSGSLLSQIICSSDTSDVWLNSIAPVSDSTFVVVGGEGTPNRTEPFIASIALTADDQIEKRFETVIHSISNSLFLSVATNPAQVPGSELVLYVLSEVWGESGDGPLWSHKISASLPNPALWTIEWSREIPGKSGLPFITWSGSLRIFEDNLYIVGHTDDPDKEPPPSSGGAWESGRAASLSLTGELRWHTTVPLTQHDDRFYGFVGTPDGLYAVGCAAGFARGSQRFGYGWISRIALDTGDVISNMTFGGDSYGSGFNAPIVSGNKIYCGG